MPFRPFTLVVIASTLVAPLVRADVPPLTWHAELSQRISVG